MAVHMVTNSELKDFIDRFDVEDIYKDIFLAALTSLESSKVIRESEAKRSLEMWQNQRDAPNQAFMRSGNHEIDDRVLELIRIFLPSAATFFSVLCFHDNPLAASAVSVTADIMVLCLIEFFSYQPKGNDACVYLWSVKTAMKKKEENEKCCFTIHELLTNLPDSSESCEIYKDKKDKYILACRENDSECIKNEKNLEELVKTALENLEKQKKIEKITCKNTDFYMIKGFRV